MSGPHSPGPSLPEGERGEKREVSFFSLLSLGERRGRGGEGRRRIVLLLLSALFGALPATARLSAAASDPNLWPEPQRAFFQDGPALLLASEERELLQALDEGGRDAFIREFLARDPLPETPANELREGIDRRRRLVAGELASPRDPRAQLLFLRGRPVERLIVDCAVAFKPLEIWAYPAADGTLRELVLYRPAAGEPFRLWLPIDSKRALYTSEMEFWLIDRGNLRARRIDRFFCPDSARVDSATGIDGLGDGTTADLTAERYGAADRRAQARRDFRWVRPENRIALLWGVSSLAAWAREAAVTTVPPEPERLELGGLELDFPRRQGQRLLARALVTLPAASGMALADVAGGAQRVRLSLQGVVEREGEVFEDFRVRYQLSPPAPGEPAALLLERALRPDQSFVLRLRIEDETSGAQASIAKGFRVPKWPERRLSADLMATAVGGEVARPGGVTGPDTLLLVPPPFDVVLGLWRAEAVVTGDRIARVLFLVDGQPQLARTRPPYSAEVQLADAPREQVVRVEGYDAAGELVAWDQVVLNQSRGGLRVLITDPPRGARVKGKVLARAEVVVPEERRVEEVEFRVGERLAASLREPPWQHEIEVPAAGELAYLTVTVRLDDGSRAEDVRFLRTPANLSEIQVELVELFVTALDSSGRPVASLGAADFAVLEGGRPQQIVRFERVDDLPLVLGIAIDTSFSMASSLDEAQRAAAGFIHNLLDARDRCFTLAFSTRPQLLLPPVDDAEAVAMSLEGLRAYGRTALHDAIVTALYYFRAERGQRALVLLTDGDDTGSGTSWEDALLYARRSGVAVYPVGLGLSGLNLSARGRLAQLAEASGGRAFFVDHAEELSGVYRRIGEELRSRYLVTYSADRPADPNGFRPIEVRVKRGFRARVSRGIYP